jgi:hypothetical protein
MLLLLNEKYVTEQMSLRNHIDAVKMRKTVDLYNMIPNLFWSILGLTPISVFCYSFMSGKLFAVLLLSSLPALLLPFSFFDRIQFNHSSSAYKKLGVHYINIVTQNGDLINRWVRKKHPQYHVLAAGKKSISKMIRQTYFFEKFHFFMFVFFTITAIDAVWQHSFKWAILITVTNIIYNVYPNFLQQYIRVRLRSSITNKYR